MIEIDGSQKSGSGTIVRNSIAMASLLKQDLHLTNIRSKRKKPGLRMQHLKAISACCEMTDGELEGAEVDSKEIVYRPGKKIKAGNYSWDIGTAGSTTMLAQTVLPLACFAASVSNIRITGGLFQDFAPAAHHLQHVVLPLLSKMGISVELEVIKPGYVPTGGGIIELKIQPVQKAIKPLVLKDQGKITGIKGIALSSHLEQREVSKRMADNCRDVLDRNGLHADIDCIYDTTSIQRGASLTIYAQTDSGCVIGMDMAGKLGRTSEFIGRRVAEMFIEDLKSGATLDRHTADQLIIYAALASGTTSYIIPRITEHVDTNLWLIDKILGTKSVLDNNSLTIHGVGYQSVIS